MRNRKIRVTAVSYLNTKPLLYGLLHSSVAEQIDLKLDIPSVCAARLSAGEADLGLIPVAAIPEVNRPRIISDYCIGAEGAVRTVCIYGNCPLQEMEALYLDHHSRTSVELAKFLLQEYWKLSPQLIPAADGYEQQIGGKIGGLIIGDRAIDLENHFTYRYDLGEHWTRHTGLPFVFAAWVSGRDLPLDFLNSFNEALRSGIEQIPKLMYLLPAPTTDFSLEEYFNRYISYRLDHYKRQGLTKFLQQLDPNLEPCYVDSSETENILITK